MRFSHRKMMRIALCAIAIGMLVVLPSLKIATAAQLSGSADIAGAAVLTGSTAHCHIAVEPSAGVMFIYGDPSTSHGSWTTTPEELQDTTDLEAEWDTGFLASEAFIGDVSYQINDNEAYVDIHLHCNVWKGDSNYVEWKYTTCSISGNDADKYKCESDEGSDTFAIYEQ